MKMAVFKIQIKMQVDKVNGYLEYKNKVYALEDYKGRVVFLILGTDSQSKDAEKAFGKALPDAKGKLVKVYVGDLSKSPEFETDKKFKVAEVPFASVYNRKLAQEREVVSSRLQGENLTNPEKIKFLFAP